MCFKSQYIVNVLTLFQTKRTCFLGYFYFYFLNSPYILITTLLPPFFPVPPLQIPPSIVPFLSLPFHQRREPPLGPTRCKYCSKTVLLMKGNQGISSVDKVIATRESYVNTGPMWQPPCNSTLLRQKLDPWEAG